MFRTIVITPETDHEQEPAMIKKLAEEGVIVHIRKPHLSADQLCHYLEKIDPQVHEKLVLHQHYELLERYALGGIHLKESVRQSTDAARLNKKYKPNIISTSFHQIDDLLSSRFQYTYVFLSPIFDSISKAGYHSNFTIEELKKAMKRMNTREKLSIPVIALGGVDKSKIELLKEMGFGGAAMLGAVWDRDLLD